MTKPNDLAFPFADVDHPNQPGLTKREWFAGEAMKGILSHFTPVSSAMFAEAYAKDATVFADALIAQLAKGEGDE